jgi:hypothetical protein
MLNFFAAHDSILWFTGFATLAVLLHDKPRTVRVKAAISLLAFSAACFLSLIIADRLGY